MKEFLYCPRPLFPLSGFCFVSLQPSKLRPPLQTTVHRMEFGGSDSSGREFKNADEMWRDQAGDPSKKTEWYRQGVGYWQVCTLFFFLIYKPSNSLFCFFAFRVKLWFLENFGCVSNGFVLLCKKKGVEASVDGVLGGYGHVNEADIQGSEAFLNTLLSERFPNAGTDSHLVALGTNSLSLSPCMCVFQV
jgi:protein N-terminal methyltransferase